MRKAFRAESREHGRRLRLTFGAPAPSRSVGSAAGTWTGVCVISDFPSQRLPASLPDDVYQSARALISSHHVGHTNYYLWLELFMGLRSLQHIVILWLPLAQFCKLSLRRLWISVVGRGVSWVILIAMSCSSVRCCIGTPLAGVNCNSIDSRSLLILLRPLAKIGPSVTLCGAHLSFWTFLNRLRSCRGFFRIICGLWVFPLSGFCSCPKLLAYSQPNPLGVRGLSSLVSADGFDLASF